MKIAIHHTNSTGAWSFSHDWIAYCEDKHIDYKTVNAFDSDIVEQVADCDIFMWHHNHMIHKDRLIAKQILYSLQMAGKVVFPDFNTGWHFDDKLGQKYMLEAVNAPLVPSYAFFSWDKAKEWIESASFPKVFKLRGGSGSSNVMLVKDKRSALKMAKKALHTGIPVYNKSEYLKEAIRRVKKREASVKDILKALAHYVIKTPLQRASGNEIGYAYFQDFIPDNKFDIRLIIVAGKYAYGMRRMCRPNDFRASGSNTFEYVMIDEATIQVAFTTAQDLMLQSVAFDFVYGENEQPLIVEMSYGFGTKGSGKCPGYWTSDMEWHEGPFNSMGWMIDALIEKATQK